MKLVLIAAWWYMSLVLCVSAAASVACAKASPPRAAAYDASSASLMEEAWRLMAPQSLAEAAATLYEPVAAIRAAAGRQAALSATSWVLSRALGAR